MVMVKTIARSGRQVGGFFIIFMIIMYGFTQAFTMVYGIRLPALPVPNDGKVFLHAAQVIAGRL
jgi:hypothetical protein